jgi:hypothetical protein
VQPAVAIPSPVAIIKSAAIVAIIPAIVVAVKVTPVIAIMIAVNLASTSGTIPVMVSHVLWQCLR